MRFEYLISEKGKRVPGTERMVRNCQRPKGRHSLLPAQDPPALGRSRQHGASVGSGARAAHTRRWSQPCSSLWLLLQLSLAWEFALHAETNIGPSDFRWSQKQHFMVQAEGKTGSGRGLPVFAAWPDAFSPRKCGLIVPQHQCHLHVIPAGPYTLLCAVGREFCYSSQCVWSVLDACVSSNLVKSWGTQTSCCSKPAQPCQAMSVCAKSRGRETTQNRGEGKAVVKTCYLHIGLVCMKKSWPWSSPGLPQLRSARLQE